MNNKSNLIFFDIDETLFETYAKIDVIKNNKIIKKLSNSEFNGYKLKEGESFSFEEFTDVEIFKKSKPISKMINKLLQLQSDKNNQLFLLTARNNFKNKDELIKYFKSYGINIGNKKNEGEIHILRCGKIAAEEKISTEDAKFKILKNIINENENKYINISFYDDYIKNVEKLSEIVNDKEFSKNNKIITYNGELVSNGEVLKTYYNNNNKHLKNIKDRKYILENNFIQKEKINKFLKDISYGKNSKITERYLLSINSKDSKKYITLYEIFNSNKINYSEKLNIDVDKNIYSNLIDITNAYLSNVEIVLNKEHNVLQKVLDSVGVAYKLGDKNYNDNFKEIKSFNIVENKIFDFNGIEINKNNFNNILNEVLTSEKIIFNTNNPNLFEIIIYTIILNQHHSNIENFNNYKKFLYNIRNINIKPLKNNLYNNI